MVYEHVISSVLVIPEVVFLRYTYQYIYIYMCNTHTLSLCMHVAVIQLLNGSMNLVGLYSLYSQPCTWSTQECVSCHSGYFESVFVFIGNYRD